MSVSRNNFKLSRAGYSNDELCRKLTAPSMIKRAFTGTLYHEFRAAINVCLTFLEGRELI